MIHFPNLRNQVLFFAVCFALTLFSAPAQSPLPDEFQSSFNKPLRTLRMNTEKFPDQRIAGMIPMPWKDDSSWCDLDVEYLQLKENPAEGDQSLRVVVKRLPQGSRAQFGLGEFPLEQGKEIRIRFLAKSPDYTPVTVGVWQKKPPFSSYFTQRIQPSAEWQEFDILVPGVFNDPDTHLLFSIQQPGTFDLDNFRFERRESKAALIPATRLGNLLPSSAFPLGAAPPWVAQGFAKSSVGELRGPTGFPALTLDIRKQPGFAPFEQSLRTGFRAAPGKPVKIRVSADLLDGEADIALRAGVEKIWEPPFGTSFKMQKGWKTYEHTIELPPAPRGYYQMQIAFEGTGKVAIDRIQIGQTDEVFALTGPIELALDSSALYGLAVDDEPFGIKLAAWGDLAAAKEIRLTLSDISGKAVEVGRYPVPQTPFEPVSAEFSAPGGFPKFGSFRLEARAYTADGSPVGEPSEVLLHRVRKARFADSPAPDSAFGIHYRTTHLDPDVSVVKKLGFNWLRLFKSFSWKRVEREKGTLDFSQTDRDVELLAENHLLALGVLGDGAPAWAAKQRDPAFKGWACWTPRDIPEFADYCAKIFERYGDKVTAFEPWNEPYYPGFFTERVEGGRRIIGSSADYLALHKAVFEKARASGRDIQIGWNTNALEEMPRTRELLDLGILAYADFVSLHHYLAQPDPASELTKQARLMREAMGDKQLPLWNTEGGLGPFTVFNFYKNVPPFQDDGHHLLWAEWYPRYYLACLASDVKPYFTYLFAAPNFWAPDYSFNNIDGRLGPNLTAMSALAWQVDRMKFVKSLTLPDGARAEVFESPARAVAAILPRPGKARKLPAAPSVTTYDLFGNQLPQGSSAPNTLHYIELAASGDAPAADQLAKILSAD